MNLQSQVAYSGLRPDCAKDLSIKPLNPYTGCLKNNFTMVFQTLLCGECYENLYT
jgi:hypothetical protein